MNTITIDYDNLATVYVDKVKDKKGFASIDFMLKDGSSVTYGMQIDAIIKILSSMNKTEENIQGMTTISAGNRPTLQIRGAILVDALLEAKTKLES